MSAATIKARTPLQLIFYLLQTRPTLHTNMTHVILFATDKADDILGLIKCEVTEKTVHITWMEPQAPNGMIILYEINYKKLGDSEVNMSTGFHICMHIRHGFTALVYVIVWILDGRVHCKFMPMQMVLTPSNFYIPLSH